ncbi:uncharacterized protein [Musca autumnalis]|uniref:uncharacterized protein n=1 Tax=Musca autumnalis TaxID=221902 RepID=UPI003CF68F27
MNVEIKTKQNSTTGGLNEMCADNMQVPDADAQEKMGHARESNAAENNSVDNFSGWLVNKYESLKIDESEGYFIIRNANESERFLLPADNFQEFLLRHACTVKHLVINPLMDIEMFNNLKILKCTLRYKRIEEFLQPEIVDNLQNVERLELKEINMEYGAAVIDEQIVENLQKMKKLRHLNLDYFFPAKIQYHYFAKLLFDMQLESLEGNLELESTDTIVTEQCPISLTKLQITATKDKGKWLDNLMNILKNLTELSLKIIGTTSADDLSSIAAVCGNLRKLQLNGCNFKNLNTFPLSTALEELHLKWCRGLSQRNLKQILAEYTIVEFSSTNTNFEGTFENFQISPTIQILKIDRLDMCDFSGAYCNNNCLLSLTWSHNKHCSLEMSTNKQQPTSVPQASFLDSEELEDLDYTETPIGIIAATNLKSCQNLTTLDMGYKNQMSLDILLQLEHLRKLSTWIMDTTTRQWSYVMALLRHSALDELSISFVRTINATSYVAAFPTKVTHLKLQDFNFNDSWMIFFLDLFAQNPILKLEFFLPPLAFVKPLRNLINHQKFPRDLKAINIYGYKVDCNELRRNFYPTMKKVKYVEPMSYVTLYRD